MWTISDDEQARVTLERSRKTPMLLRVWIPGANVDVRVGLDDDALRELADAIDEYFAAQRL